MRGLSLLSALAASLPLLVTAATTWKQVKIGGGGGFVPGIVFSTKDKGVAYARTDIGGLYKLNADDSWTPLLDGMATNDDWHNWGVDALAIDPTNSQKVYVAVGMYTNSWDPNNGSILASSNGGSTWTKYALSFKVGGNMPGRGMGERLAVDPNLPSTLYFGARSGNGLWKSTNSGATWAKVTSFPSVGTYIQDPNDANGYANDIVGLAWVTFDASSSTSGTATKRIFVGVANVGTNSVFVSNDAGVTWSAVAGQPLTDNIPHKGVISPSDKLLYITYNNNAGPYDGTLGSVYKYSITAGTWTNITPTQDSPVYYGFGGLAVDLQRPGTIMVATLNSWWPDGNIFRSTDSGATWTALWSWASYPTMNFYYTYDTSLAPWIGAITGTPPDYKRVGWMMEALVIDPFDSNHWLYGTGLTIYGGRNLLNWDSSHMVTIKSLADGIEEDAILALISPPTGANLISAVGDNCGYVHNSLTTAPAAPFMTPHWATTSDIDYAGGSPSKLVRIGNDQSGGNSKQVATSSDGGATWALHYGAPDSFGAGKVAYSALATTVLWATANSGVQVSSNQGSFVTVSSLPTTGVAIASDKVSDTIFYAASTNKFYVSTNSGSTFTASAVTLGASTEAKDIVVHPLVTGDVWVSTDKGLFHSTNSGAAFSTIAGFSAAYSISVGAPKTAGSYPSFFVIGVYNSAPGVYRTDDGGASWVRLDSSAALQFGSASANTISGDRRIWGRVYVGTNGRGIFYGDDNGSAQISSTVQQSASASTSRATTSSSVRTTTSSSSVRTTSSSVRTTSTSSRTTSSAAPTGSCTPIAKYGQCGGANYTGCKICAAGSVCTFSNDFYSQCL